MRSVFVPPYRGAVECKKAPAQYSSMGDKNATFASKLHSSRLATEGARIVPIAQVICVTSTPARWKGDSASPVGPPVNSVLAVKGYYNLLEGDILPTTVVQRCAEHSPWLLHLQSDANKRQTRSCLHSRVYQQASSIAYGSNPKPSTTLYRAANGFAMHADAAICI